MTCGHPQISREPCGGITVVTCRQCLAIWKECPVHLEDEDYAVWLELSSPDWEEDTEDI